MKKNINNYKILGILLLLSVFTINQAMEKAVETEEKKEPKNLVKLAALQSAKNIVEFYDNEFKNDPENAFKAMQAYINSKNIPSELLQNIYYEIVHSLKRIDIFIRELILENEDKVNLSIFFNLDFNSKYKLVSKLIQILLHKNKKFPDISPEAAEKLLVAILENYPDIKFYDEILVKLIRLRNRYSNYVPGTDLEKIFKKANNKAKKRSLIKKLESMTQEALNFHYRKNLKETPLENKELFGKDIEKTENAAIALVDAFDDDEKIKANNILEQLSREDQDHVLNYLFDRYFEEDTDYLAHIFDFIDFLFPEKDKAHDKVLALYLRLEKLYPQFSELLDSSNVTSFGSKVDILLELNIYLMTYYEHKILSYLMEISDFLEINNPPAEKKRNEIYHNIKIFLLEEYLSLGVEFVNHALDRLLWDINASLYYTAAFTPTYSNTLSDSKLINFLQLLTDKKRIKILEIIQDWLQEMISENKLPEDIFKIHLAIINESLSTIKSKEGKEKEDIR